MLALESLRSSTIWDNLTFVARIQEYGSGCDTRSLKSDIEAWTLVKLYFIYDFFRANLRYCFWLLFNRLWLCKGTLKISLISFFCSYKNFFSHIDSTISKNLNIMTNYLFSNHWNSFVRSICTFLNYVVFSYYVSHCFVFNRLTLLQFLIFSYSNLTLYTAQKEICSILRISLA